LAVHYVTHNGSDTYANATSFSTPCSLATAAAGYAAGDEIRICETGTYTLTGTITLTTSGSTGSGEVLWVGANSSGTVDGTRPTITTATNSIPLFSINNGSGFHRFRYLKGTNTAGTRAAMFAGTGTSGQSNVKIESCWCDGCSYLWDGSSRACTNLSAIDTHATNCTTGVILNNAGAATVGTNQDVIDGCHFYNNTGPCYNANGSSANLLVVRSTLAKNGRAISDGGAGSARTFTLTMRDSTIANNTTEGLTNANAATTWWIADLSNNIIYGNGGYGVGLLNTAAANDARSGVRKKNFVGSNTSGNYNNLTAPSDDVALTADPFTNAAAGDFSLNNAAGGGAAIRAAGFPGAFVGGLTTGYPDGGAVQHQDSGGTGGVTVPTPVIGQEGVYIG
jgi:hypothetical protein